ncbi:MAG: hypothetical protein EPN37_16545 [Chitinophagaceae bacterium]|nr:MAG: hypothetical protein EPN37_16545 [Chitinophagaceae bacterium]
MRSKLSLLAALIVLTPSFLVAQNNNEIIFKKTSEMAVSNNFRNFPDSLMQYNKDAGLSWLIANDPGNLYVFLKVSDKRVQHKILMGGITIGLNTRGKKKTKSSVTFPVIDQEAFMAQMNALRNSSSTLAANEFENMQRERISEFNDIKVSGLKKIDNGDIPLSNQYGIEAKIFYDSAGDLIDEVKLPFQYTDLSASLKNDIAVQVKINGFDYKNIQGNYSGNTGSGSWGGERGTGHRGMASGGGGFHGGGNWHRDSEENHSSGSATRGSVDFWIKAPLAQ